MEDVMDREAVSIDFKNLPEDIWWILFNYLSIPERRIFGRVCKKWYEISRHPDPIFWKNVVVLIKSHRTRPMSVRTMGLLQMLPQSVSSLKLYYAYNFYMCDFTLEKLSLALLTICPNLEELIIDNAEFRDAENFRVINLSKVLSKKLRILKLRQIQTFHEVKLIFEDSYISNIEVFDISYSSRLNIDPSFLSQMPRLRELNLAGIRLKEDFFDSLIPVIKKLNILDFKCIDIPICSLRNILEIVRNNALNLIELYVCYKDLVDSDIRCLKDTTVLPQLKKICLRGCAVSFMEINSLTDSRSSLELVYVGNLSIPEWDEEQFDYTLCNSTEVVKLYNENFDGDCEHGERHCLRNII